MQMTEEEKKEKEAMVKKYLQGLFPGCDVQTKWDFDSNDLLFRIDEADGQIKHLGEVTYEFLAVTKTEEIPGDLDRLQLKSILDMAGGKKVLVSTKGVRIHKS